MVETVETNIKLFHQRKDLYVWGRHAHLSGPHLAQENAEKVCVKLASERGLAAIVKPHSDSSQLLVATKRNVRQMIVEVSDLSFTLTDADEPNEKITLASPYGERILPLLLVRAMTIKLMRSDFCSGVSCGSCAIDEGTKIMSRNTAMISFLIMAFGLNPKDIKNQ